MRDRLHVVRFSVLTIILVGCGGASIFGPPTVTEPPTPLPTTPAPSATPSEAPAPTVTPTVLTATPTAERATPTHEPCEIVAEGDVTVYSRPSLDASVFGTMTAGTRIVAAGRTPNGWVGFEPGVAQAANVGVFRLRWVETGGGIRLVGACDQLPELEGPPAGVCFTMPMTEISVYAEADETSAVIATMVVGEYASVIGRTEEWARVDLSVGNTGLDQSGWVREHTLNLNGPCDSLPVVEP